MSRRKKERIWEETIQKKERKNEWMKSWKKKK